MTPDQLSGAVLHTVRQAVAQGELVCEVPEAAGLRKPPHGGADWSTSIALRLAGPAGRPAREIAGLLGERLRQASGVAGVDVSGPGFLDIRVTDAAAGVLAELAARRPARALPDDPARDVRRWAEATGDDPARLLVQRAGNPLFRVRYAHARSQALLRGGAALGLGPEPAEGHRLTEPAERRLLAELAEGGKSRTRTRRLITVADAFLETAAAAPALPVGEEKPSAVHRARLALAQAGGAVLAEGLHKLGISAPDHL